MVPTKERNVSAVFLSYGTEGILFDCGEGTQRQMNIAGINRNKITKILISHWHGDHISGLVGLLQTVNNQESEKTIHLFGPEGTEENMKSILKLCQLDSDLTLKIHELKPTGVEKCFDSSEYFINCASLSHGIPCIGYSFVEKDRRRINMQKLEKMGVREGRHLQELQAGKSISWKGKNINVDDVTTLVKGKKITYIMDTLLNDNCVELAKESDVLVCESAYANDLIEKAEKYKHLTAQQAALIASNASAKKLVLTHFSQRYKNTLEIQEDARAVFDNIVCAEDFMKIKV